MKTIFAILLSIGMLTIWTWIWSMIWYFNYQTYYYTGKYETVPFKHSTVLEYRTNYLYTDNHNETLFHHTRPISESYQPPNQVSYYLGFSGEKYSRFGDYFMPRFLTCILPSPLLPVSLAMVLVSSYELIKVSLKKKRD